MKLCLQANVKTIVLSLFLLIGRYASAQYVTIPDTNFVRALKNHYVLNGCISGNQLDTTCKGVTGLRNLDISYSGALDLTGLQYFDSLFGLMSYGNAVAYWPRLPSTLKRLEVGNSVLDVWPQFPEGLESLTCYVCNISSIPALPSSLKALFCSDNMLKGLPTLPAALEYLNCSNNIIEELPALPPGLKSLVAIENKLETLPLLPSGLRSIDVKSNRISHLPALPQELRQLNILGNVLDSLPALPDSLANLSCSNNRLTSMPLLPPGLEILSCGINRITGALSGKTSRLIHVNCDSNSITGLDIHASSIQSLSCNGNLITRLPAMPEILTLSCSKNKLLELPLLPPSLISLDCSFNQIEKLPELPGQLRVLNCRANKLAELPDLPQNSLGFVLDCADNQITDLPALPKLLEWFVCRNNRISCLPVLPDYGYTRILYENIRDNPFTCLPNYITNMDAATLAYPLCKKNDSDNPSECSPVMTINGTIFMDSDNNCLYSSGEKTLLSIPIILRDSNGIILSRHISYPNGVFQFMQQEGKFKIEVDTAGLPVMPACAYPGSDSVFVLDARGNHGSMDFAFKCKDKPELDVHNITSNGRVFPGQNHVLMVTAGDVSKYYGMSCAGGLSGKVMVSVSGKAKYLGPATGALTPSNVVGNDLTYTVPDFGKVNNQADFNIRLSVDTNALATDSICVYVSVTSESGLKNKYKRFCYSVNNSHDPNVKEVYPVRVPENYRDWLTYTVHFQNTGSAPAYNIRLADTLDEHLDIETFQLLGQSHEMTATLRGRALNFKFKDIMLPDSHTNSEGSHGFVQYRIKPLADLPLGTKISNTAFIYFDYNEPVVTNTTVNEYVSQTSSIDRQKIRTAIKTYPNPSGGKVNISLSGPFKLTVTDITGQLVLETHHEGEITLPKGLFFFEYVVDGIRIVDKVVVY
jgi:uncharacterized repeat protein (TIGR01451 family)